jgi:hypothetical protein
MEPATTRVENRPASFQPVGAFPAFPNTHLPICGSVKTTIDLPDDVFLKATILAAERGLTFKDVVIQGLKLFTETPPEADLKKRKSELKRLLKGFSPDSATAPRHR